MGTGGDAVTDAALLIKERIAEQVTDFGLVAIASNLGAAMAALDVVPAAFIIRASRTADPNTLETGGFSQRLTESYSVLIAGRATGDVSGEITSLAIEAMSQAVMSALIGWEPDADHDPMEYTGGALAEWTEPALMLWMDDFQTARYLRA